MNRRIVLLLCAILLGSALAGCKKPGAADSGQGPAGRPAVAVETAAVTPSDVTEGIEVVGSLAPRYQAEIKSEISGRVAEVLVTQWARVKQGDPLARIETSELEVTLRKARAAVQAAQAAAETVKANRETAQAGAATARAAGESARSALAEAQVAAERAQREFERMKSLKASGLATQQALDDAGSQRDAAQARIATLRSQIAAAEAQVQVADSQVRAADAQIQASEAQLAVAREDVTQVEARLSKAVVRAPFEGTVAERLVNPGEVVGEMQKVIFSVVDNRLLDLTVTVPSAKMAALSAGQTLSFTVDSFPGRAFAGTVRFINPGVDASDRSVRVTAEVPNVPEVLKGGLFAKGFIVTGARTGVLRVPRTALFNWDTEAGKADLYAVEGGVARLRSIKVGAVQGDQAEIVSGLDAGARVVVRGGFNLKDGDQVKATAAGGGN